MTTTTRKVREDTLMYQSISERSFLFFPSSNLVLDCSTYKTKPLSQPQKGHLEQNQLTEALEGFQRILEMDAETNPSRDEWAFKALKQVAKIKARFVVDSVISTTGPSPEERGGGEKSTFSSAADALLGSYGDMLALSQRGAVTAPVAEKKLSSLLDFLATTLGGAGETGASSCSASSSAATDAERKGNKPSPGERVLERVYLATLNSLAKSSAAAAAAAAAASACSGGGAGNTTTTAASRANDRLAFRTRLRLAALWLDQRAHDKAAGLLDELLEEQNAQPQPQQPQQPPESRMGEAPPASAGATGAAAVPGIGVGVGDARAGTATLDVLALQIRLRTECGDAARSLKPLHRAASAAVALAIPHPRVVGVVRECGGLVAMADRDWRAAATDFFEAFKSYDEAGSRARGRCLRRCALAAMLLRSGVDPFEAQEARPFRADPAVRGTTELVRAYQASDALEFERVFADAKEKARIRWLGERESAELSSSPPSSPIEDDSLGGDRLFEAHLGDLRSLLRRAVALRACAPYARVRLSHLAERLGVPADEAEATVAGLILDGELEGASIDQVAGTVELGRRRRRKGEKGGGGAAGSTAVGDAATAAATAAAAAAATAAASSSSAADVTTEVKRAAAVRAWAGRTRELQGLVVARMQAA